MKKYVGISALELEGGEGLLVQFTDGTLAGYTVEELLELRPLRERLKLKAAKRNPVLGQG
jgi:hypothetical protein